MDIILYNPLSRNGKNEKFIQKIMHKLKLDGRPVVSYNILAIDDVDSFVSGCNEDDRIIVIGGDGTINHLANRIHHMSITQDLCLYQAGTGNDFVRSLKTKEKIVPIKEHIKSLPVIRYQDQDRFFLNGVGAGLDGYIAYLVNHSKYKKNKLNYFRHAFEGFAKFKPMSATIQVDDQTFKENKIWFASMMNSAYFGGGMKIAPKANRQVKDLSIVIIKNIPKWLLFLIFPTIYLGWHTMFKRWVKIISGQHVQITFDKPTYLQVDGDTEYPIESFEVKAAK
ncbi:MAG: diacylglycerol kinase family protein [Acholeplasmataceae bacterium]|jgi:diacylglycerol kinase family enzyme|nr:diacylglycerol kinase family protein [Acholeplasmataceae bacterium]